MVLMECFSSYICNSKTQNWHNNQSKIHQIITTKLAQTVFYSARVFFYSMAIFLLNSIDIGVFFIVGNRFLSTNTEKTGMVKMTSIGKFSDAFTFIGNIVEKRLWTYFSRIYHKRPKLIYHFYFPLCRCHPFSNTVFDLQAIA